MDLAELEIFRAVAREGSVTRAAERLSRVQSNVTTRVRQLEDALGVSLFQRAGKRMLLTTEGETLLAYAERLLALAEEARQALRPGQPQGRLRIGTMESTAASRLPEPLARFHRLWPAVALELTTGTSEALIERVLAQRLDGALVATPPAGERLDPALEATPLFTEELLLALPAGHPPVERPADLQVGSLAALERGCTYRRMVEAWLAGRPLRVLELGSYHAILACVAAGTSLGVVPRSVLALQGGPAVRSTPLARVTTLLIRRRDYRSAAFEAWRETLLEAAAASPAP